MKAKEESADQEVRDKSLSCRGNRQCKDPEAG